MGGRSVFRSMAWTRIIHSDGDSETTIPTPLADNWRTHFKEGFMANDIFGDYDVPIFPDIAVNPDGSNNDITDPTSGQPNVSTPASPIPLDGWPGNGIPIFSDFNRLFRMITQWIRWLYDHIIAAEGDITDLEAITGSYANITASGTLSAPGDVTINMTLPSGFTWDNTYIVATTIEFDTAVVRQCPWSAGSGYYGIVQLTSTTFIVYINDTDHSGTFALSVKMLIKKIA